MTRGEENAKRKWWRPRFSVRTLAIVVTLVCVYIAAWMPTKRAAEEIGSPDNPTPWLNSNMGRGCTVIDNAHSPAPFVITQIEWGPTDRPANIRRQYYLWFFGHTRPLPFWTNYTPQPDDGKQVQIYRDRKTGRRRSAQPPITQPLPHYRTQ